MPNIGQCELFRKDYRYPPARLNRCAIPGSNTVSWIGRHYQRMDPPALGWNVPGSGYTSHALDSDHSHLLNIPNPDQNIDGLLSIIYWGYFANRYGKRLGYAISRTGWALIGKPRLKPVPWLMPPSTVAQIQAAVVDARTYVQAGDYNAALSAICRINFIGSSFASKVVAFMDPDRCGVLDNVIQQKLTNSALLTLNTINIMHGGYQRYCDFCVDRAKFLNAAGSAWTDWDGAHWPWRAIDVERVIFSSPGDPGPILI